MSTPDSRSRTRAPTRPRKALRTILLPRTTADPRVSPIFSFSRSSSEQRIPNRPPERAAWSRSPTPSCSRDGAEWLRAHRGPGLGGLGAASPRLLTCSRRLGAAAARAANSTALQPSEAAPPPGGRSVPQPPPPSPRGSRKWRVRGSPGPAAERPASLRQRRVLGPGARRSPLLPLLPLLHAPPAPPRPPPPPPPRAQWLRRSAGGSGRVSPPPSASPVSSFLLPLLLLKQILWPQIATRLPPSAPPSGSCLLPPKSEARVREPDTEALGGEGERARGAPQHGSRVWGCTTRAGARVASPHLEAGGNLVVTVASEVPWWGNEMRELRKVIF